jgi:hypothetical protein
MRIYLPALSRVRLAKWLSQKPCIPGFDKRRWERFLRAEEELLFPAEVLLLSVVFSEEQFALEGELQLDQVASLLQ